MKKRRAVLKLYCNQLADVWSCGVTLYVMLVGGYPFEDPDEPRDFRKTIQVCYYFLHFFSMCMCVCDHVLIFFPYLVCMIMFLYVDYLVLLYFLMHAADSQCSVLYPRHCSNISRVSPSDIKDLCRRSCCS